MFLPVALLVTIGIVILLWGRCCVFACSIACETTTFWGPTCSNTMQIRELACKTQ